MKIEDIIKATDRYNLHSHTQFCDGRFPMEEMAASAAECRMLYYGFSPHSPICCDSPCNMSRGDVPVYIDEAARLREVYSGRMEVLTSMEIDFISPDFGPHIDYFQNMQLDYRLASVHFVPTQDGVWLDCDGRFERFARYLKEDYKNDLRYVVEKYFENVIRMIEDGGFEILGHFDKIAGNAALADPEIENAAWYEALVDDVLSHASSAGVIVEINTKSYADKKRFFPAFRWWDKIRNASLPVVVNSDAHYPDKVNAGREEALKLLTR